MNEILIIALIFAMLLTCALVLYFIKFIIGKIEKYFLSREEALVVIGVILLTVGIPLGSMGLLGAGVGILFADWVLNWEKLKERYRQS